MRPENVLIRAEKIPVGAGKILLRDKIFYLVVEFLLVARGFFHVPRELRHVPQELRLIPREFILIP